MMPHLINPSAETLNMFCSGNCTLWFTIKKLRKFCEWQFHMLLFICATIRGLCFFLLPSLHNGQLLKQGQMIVLKRAISCHCD